MTAPTTDRDTTVEVDVDFEKAVACETVLANILDDVVVGQSRRCENPAEWAGRAPCCGNLSLCCTPHKFAPNGWFCPHCRKSIPDLIWTKL